MPKKDPAFLFYPKDWLQGTSNMMPEEKGVYIDLLCHQHQDKDLPSDTKRLARMVGLSEVDFLKIWEVIGQKFKPNGSRLVNQKLNQITTERLTKSVTNKITGTFAALIRTSNLDYETKEKLKKEFKIDAFLTESEETVAVRLTDWLQSRLKSIGNGNGNIKGGAGGKKGIDKNIFGIEFTDDKEFVILSNGEKQGLGKNQKIRLELKDIKPEDIWKNYIT